MRTLALSCFQTLPRGICCRRVLGCRTCASCLRLTCSTATYSSRRREAAAACLAYARALAALRHGAAALTSPLTAPDGAHGGSYLPASTAFLPPRTAFISHCPKTQRAAVLQGWDSGRGSASARCCGHRVAATALYAAAASSVAGSKPALFGSKPGLRPHAAFLPLTLRRTPAPFAQRSACLSLNIALH